jgi:hypothetical protein
MSKVDKALLYFLLSFVPFACFFIFDVPINSITQILFCSLLILFIFSGLYLFYQLDKEKWVNQIKINYKSRCEKRLLRLHLEDSSLSYNLAAEMAYEEILLESSEECRNIIESDINREHLCARISDNAAAQAVKT